MCKKKEVFCNTFLKLIKAIIIQNKGIVGINVIVFMGSFSSYSKSNAVHDISEVILNWI